MRVCGGYAGGLGDGARGWDAIDCGAGTVSDRGAAAGRETGIFVETIAGFAGFFREARWWCADCGE